MASRILETETVNKTFDKGSSVKSWDNGRAFSEIQSASLSPTNWYSTSNGAQQSVYQWTGMTAVSQQYDVGAARITAPTMVIYSSVAANPITATTSFGFRSSIKSLIQSCLFKDRKSGVICNWSNQEGPLFMAADMYLKNELHADEQALLYYQPVASGNYSGGDWASSGSGTTTFPFTQSPVAPTSGSTSTFIANPLYNHSATASSLQCRQTGVFNPAALNSAQSPFGTATSGWVFSQVDLARIDQLHPACADLSFIHKGFEWDLTIGLSNIQGALSTSNALWSNLGNGLSVAFLNGINVQYQPLVLDHATQLRFDAHLAHSFVKHMPYLSPVVYQLAQGSTAVGPQSYTTPQWQNLRMLMVFPLPAGSMTSGSSFSPLITQAVHSSFNVTVNNVSLEPSAQFGPERAFNELCSYLGTDIIPAAIARYIKRSITFADYQAFFRILVQDFRPYAHKYGDKPITVGIQMNRVDASGSPSPLDIWCVGLVARQWDYNLNRGVVSVSEVA